MLDKIKKLEKISTKLELKQKKRTEWNQAVQNYIENFLEDFNKKYAFQVSEYLSKGFLQKTNQIHAQ